MDFDRIVDAACNFFSLKKFFWFLTLFWLAFPVLVFIPWAISKNYFSLNLEPIVVILFFSMYFCLLTGLIVLLQYFCFNKKINFNVFELKKILLIFPLVFIELFYVFVWNLHKSLRFSQILLLLGIPLLNYYLNLNPNNLIRSFFVIFVFFYILIIIYNSVRLIFTIPIFFIKNESIFQSPKSSWALTHNKFNSVFMALFLIFGVLIILFLICYIISSFFFHIVFSVIFLPRISSELSIVAGTLFALGPVLVAYYSSFTELFDQLLKDNESSNIIKKILSKKVLSTKSNKKKILKKKLKNKK